jgi:hypothetical protein
LKNYVIEILRLNGMSVARVARKPSKKGRWTMTRRLSQAYQQAPWRIEVQRVGLVALGIIVAAIIAMFYLSISARTAATALKIRDLESDMAMLQEENASISAQLAAMTTASEMEKRAIALGYEVVQPENTQYLIVTGYNGRPTVILLPPPSAEPAPATMIKPSYTLSLWEWFHETLLSAPMASGGIK